MLQPKKQKHRKQFRGKMRGMANIGNKIAFGEYGLKALTCSWVTAKQIESARKAIAHYTKRAGKIWIRIFPDKPFTKRAAESRMGSGKGSPEGFVAVVKPGRIMFELGGVCLEIAREAMRLAGHKLPVKSEFVKKM